jgi:hypothetical protein
MRKGSRSRTLKTGRILLPGGGVMDCAIRDISETGARIRIGAATPLPKRFQLHCVTDATVADAELRWQRGTEAGLAFLDKPRPARID